MRKPAHDMSAFKERRDRLSELIEGSVLILPSHPNHIRNNDVHHDYRQDSNLFYMTGFEEPGSIFIFRPGQDPETIMFVRRKNVDRETWDGFRYGIEGVKAEFGMQEAYAIDEFEKVAPELLKEANRVYYSLFNDYEFDARFARVLEHVKNLRGRSGLGLLPIEDSYPLIGEMRVIKTPHEAEMMREACRISAEAHVDVMKATRPGVNERALHGVFIHGFMSRGAAREAYGSIVASGANATTLHYVFNDQECKDGDLLLIDAGAEYNYYAGDITRTYPVNGKFTDLQRRLYQGVLDVQKSVIGMVKPGVEYKAIQDEARRLLLQMMIDDKLLKGSFDELLESGTYRRYYPHNVSHWLGSDVHDAGLSVLEGQPRKLEPGMCLTVEPGLYIPADDESVAEEMRGIGIRIEDDIMVTEGGCEVFTSGAPKEISDLEALIGQG